MNTSKICREETTSKCDTEDLVKSVIKEKLKFDTEVKIERAHRVGKPPRAPFEMMEDGSRKKIPPRPTSMLEIEGSYSASCKRRQVKADKGNSFFPGPFGKNIAEER